MSSPAASRFIAVLIASFALVCLAGCSWVAAEIGTDLRGENVGKTYYLGGAGALGHVGTIDVPNGLRAGRYKGAIEVVGWQTWFGDVLRDQIDRARNEVEAERFAQQITDYLDTHPGRRVNIIALSAGTGIATWALEKLPEDYNVGSVVFFGSSLSRHYDLTLALRHVDEKLYNFYSADDPILRYALPIAGTVDREFSDEVAGRFGFASPRLLTAEANADYLEKLRNMPPLRRYRRYGYKGGHTDGVGEDFIRAVVAPIMTKPLEKSDASASQFAPPTSQPASTAPARSATAPARATDRAERVTTQPAPPPKRRSPSNVPTGQHQP